MANILDYLDWRGDLQISERGFNEVDNLLLAELCYLDFGGIVPPGFDAPVPLQEAMRRYDVLREHESMGVLVPDQIPELGRRMAASARFSGLLLCGYENKIDDETQTQFSALTLLLPDGTAYVAFRGTDDTIVGWKEDFNLAFATPVPAQLEAVRYLKQVADVLACPLRVGGHSKGGNLAVYAAAFVGEDVQERILNVFNNDGPGHDLATLESAGYRRIEKKLQTFIPKSSIIGMLLEHQENYKIVKSSSISIWQHNPFSWEINGDDFSYRSELTGDARYLNATLNQWIRAMSAEERAQLVDTIYGLIDLDNIATFAQLRAEWQTSFPEIFRSFSGLSPQNKAFLLQMLKELASMGIKNFPELFE